jgi:nucleoside-diphosphate-sugar epimerase
MHYHADGAVRFERIQWHVSDLLDPTGMREAMQGVERVFHCAAIVSFDPRDAKAMLRENIGGTANVVNAMLAAGVQRLCHVSSTATIGLRADGRASTETDAFVQDRKSSPYAISKHEAEMEVQRGIAEGLHAVLVNPCIVLGPGAPGRSSMTMIERVRRGTRFYPPGSNAVVDARDVAAAMLRAMDVAAVGERHLLIGENLSYRALFATIAGAFGQAPPTTPLRPWMLELGWRVERLRALFFGRPFITRHTARTAYRQRAYDGAKARTALGMAFRDARESVRNVAVFLEGSR